jgi:hypothetical protein
MMSRGVELPWVVYGRRLRPFSFAIMLSTIVVGVQYVGLGEGPGSVLADGFTGGFAFIGAALLLLGWATMNDDVHDWGLLLCGGVWAGRATLYMLEDGPDAIGFWLSMCWVVGIMGAYALERYDHKWRYHLARGDD